MSLSQVCGLCFEALNRFSCSSSVPEDLWQPVVWLGPLLSDPLAKHVHTSNVLCSQLLWCSHIENWLWSARPEKVQKLRCVQKPQVSSRLSATIWAKLLLICGIIFCAPLDICRAWSSVKGTKLNLTAFGHTQAHQHLHWLYALILFFHAS